MGVSDERFMALVCKGVVEVKGIGEMGSLNLNQICLLNNVSNWVQELIESTGDAFGITPKADGLACLSLNKPGRILKKIANMSIPDDPRFNALYKLEPYIEMVVNRFKKFGVHQVLPWASLDAHVDDAVLRMNHLNCFVEALRQEVKSARFQSKLNSYHRSSNKNYKELMKYVEALFERYSRLLVLRVDLSYSKENSNVTLAEAKRDRERLFQNSRSNNLFDAMVGYIWKLERGPEKGFHYHVMFFFDGAIVREDVTLAMRIGQYWMDVITKGRGLYFNCNADKRKYIKCGVGMINYYDETLREGLREAVVYLAKTDLFMKLQTEGRGMGKGLYPSPKDPRGRPRAATLSKNT